MASQTCRYTIMSFEEFIQSLSPLDLRARSANSRAEYRRRYLDALRLPSAAERAQIARAFVPARLDTRMRQRGLVLPRRWPPCIVLVHENPLVEGGMPHTQSGLPGRLLGRLPVIVMPASEFQLPEFAITLQHEYTHVLQRTFPEQFADWYRANWGVVEVPISALGKDAVRRRANPDAMSLFAPEIRPEIRPAMRPAMRPARPAMRPARPAMRPAMRPARSTAPWAVLYHKNPQSLKDCACATGWEHPHERLAYELEMW